MTERHKRVRAGAGAMARARARVRPQQTPSVYLMPAIHDDKDEGHDEVFLILTLILILTLTLTLTVRLYGIRPLLKIGLIQICGEGHSYP